MTTSRLPLRSTRLYGRDDELAAVHALLRQSSLVTLTGAGGCGKTRLALEVARTHAGEVCWVDLAAVNDPHLVPHVVRSSLSLADRPGEDPTEWLVQAVHGRDVLLLLDNCEHLMDACVALVARLASAGANVLTTSREPLGVEGERTLRVQSLPEQDAVALFLDRAGSQRPDLLLDECDRAAVEEICLRLDGIPLAIELAAARLRMMTPRQIADELENRFHLLTGGARTAVPRQRTLEASVGWSHDLLTDDERALLRRLSVFPSRFELAAVRMVSRYGDASVDLLAGLIDKSLVDVDVHGEQARYALPETIRVYAQERLLEANEASEVRDRHLEFFLERSAELEIGMFGPDLLTQLARADADLADLRAAMDWGLASGRPALALEIAGNLWMFWFLHTRPAEGRLRLEAVLQAAPEAPDLARYKALLAILMLCALNDWNGAQVYSAQALMLAEQLDDDRLRSQALVWRGQVTAMLGPGDGLADLEESLRLAQRTGDQGQICRSLQWLGTVLCQQGQTARGSALLDESIAMARETGNQLQLGWVLSWRSHAAAVVADNAAVERFAHEALQVLTSRGEVGFTAVPLLDLAFMAVYAGRFDEASNYCAEARTAAVSSASIMPRAVALMSSGMIKVFGGNSEQALPELREAEALFERGGMRAYGGLATVGQGSVARLNGDLETAERLLQDGLQRSGRDTFARARALIALSQLAFDQGRGQEALERARECLHLAHTTGDRVAVVEALEAVGAGLWSRDDIDAASRVFGAAERLRREIDYVRFPVDQVRLDPLVELAQTSPGWAEGREMSTDEVVAWLERGRGQRGRPSSGWESLTPTELDVAGLIAQGLSNPDVATKLFISRNTVKAHVAHIFAKLDISTRSELAAHAARRLTQGKG